MSDLDILAREARSAPTGVAPTPMDALHRRADRRRGRKRMAAGGVLSIAVLLVVAGVAIGVGRHTPDPSVQVGPAGSVTTTAPPTSSESTTGSTATTEAPTTTTTAPPLPSTSTAAPQPAQLEVHGLSTDGLKPVTFDMNADQVSALLGVPVPANGTAAGCGAPETRHLYDVLPGVDLVFPGGGQLRYVGVSKPGVTTLSGIGVGTPVQTLTAKLPNAVRSDVSQTVYTVFNSDHSRSIAFHIGADGNVASMLAGVGDMTNVLDYC
jgi:hypothetical protein